MLKIRLFLLGCCVASFNCVAESSQSLQDCRAVSNALERLVCYDELVDSLAGSKALSRAVENVKTVPSVPPAGASKPVAKAPPAKPAKPAASVSDEAEFGLPDKVRAEEVDSIIASVTKVKKDPYGKKIISLDNGTVWQQTDGKRFSVDDGDAIIIERGALSAFYLGLQGNSKRIRVKRLQ